MSGQAPHERHAHAAERPPSLGSAEIMLAEGRRAYEDNVEHFRDLEKKATWLAGGVGGAIVALVGLWSPERALDPLPTGAPEWQRWLVYGLFTLACAGVAAGLLLLVWSLQVAKFPVPDPYRLVRRKYAKLPTVVVSTIAALEYAQVAKSGLRVLRRKASFYWLATIALVGAVVALGLFGLTTACFWALRA